MKSVLLRRDQIPGVVHLAGDLLAARLAGVGDIPAGLVNSAAVPNVRNRRQRRTRSRLDNRHAAGDSPAAPCVQPPRIDFEIGRLSNRPISKFAWATSSVNVMM